MSNCSASLNSPCQSAPESKSPCTPKSTGLWSTQKVLALFEQPFMDLMHQAQTIHRENFPLNKIQISKLLSIKTGSCPEDCSYCSQSAHFKTSLQKEPLMELEAVLVEAQKAKDGGASRFCMGAAWRGPRDQDLDKVIEMVKGVKAMGLETCVTLGLLKGHQAEKLKEAGLDYYNHNLDTSPEFYKEIITTRTFEDRLETLHHVQESGIKVCCGGIIGMGESQQDRASMLSSIANMDPQPESVPINWLIRVPGTPMADNTAPDPFDFVKTIAVARIVLPYSYVRLSAGRDGMSDELQALCFLAGANSIFNGDVLLTAKNPSIDKDNGLLERLGITGI